MHHINSCSKITLSELSAFDRDYMPASSGTGGLNKDQKSVSWSPGYDGQFRAKRPLPITGAHRRRTLKGLAGAGAGAPSVGITPSSAVLWMRLGRTTSLVPTAWVGDYADLGDGQCATMEGHTPSYGDALSTPSVGHCQGKCDTNVACYGFSWKRGLNGQNTCRLWKESGLRGGGKQWGGCKCKVKLFDVVRDNVASTGKYVRMGAGKCLAGAGRDYPESVFHQNVDEKYCTSRCDSSTECFGYTWNGGLKHCYLWKLTDLRAPPEGTAGTSGESCMMKVDRITPPGAPVSSAPPNAAPMLPPFNVGAPNTHAIKISLGRSISNAAVSWNGQWKKQVPAEGRCMTSSAQEPSHKMIDGADAAKCQNTCASDYSCNGYSWSNLGRCLIWMQPDLWGGGTKEGGFNCMVKQYAVLSSPVISTGQFVVAGPGMCKTGWDTNPASTYMGKIKRAQCNAVCLGDTTCTGFSWQPTGECANHFEAGLRSSKSTFGGNILCYVKDYQQAPGVSGKTLFQNNANTQYGGPPQQSALPPAQAASTVSTTSTQAVPAGATVMQVPSTVGFSAGSAVDVDLGTAIHEVNTIQAFGSLVFASPLQFAHPAGAVISQVAPAAAAAAGAGFAASARVGATPGHSTVALLGAGAAGAGAALLGQHLLSKGKAALAPAAPKPSARALPGVSGPANHSGLDKAGVFQFWTPAQPGTPTCKTDIPTRYFPGKTEATSQAAWPSKHQPRNLECWHHEAPGAAALAACWYTKILFSSDRGWPGRCQGLMEADTKGLSCQESCKRDTSCPVWQEQYRSNGKVICYQGRGRDCPGQRSGSKTKIKAAQRLQHGSVRKLMSLKGMEVKNLRQDFDATYYSDKSEAAEACKYLCYSDIQCTYWLYSTTDGCFVEDPPTHSVPYPLTQGVVNQNSDFARSVTEGEYILHRCPENDGTFTSEDEGAPFTMLPWEWNWFASQAPWDEGGWSWWTWLLFFIWLCCCGCCCFLFCSVCGVCNVIKNRSRGKSDDGDKKKRKSGPDSDSDSGSSSSSSEASSRRGSSKKSLLQAQNAQHMNTLAQGHGQQATHAYHSSGGSVHGARPGYHG